MGRPIKMTEEKARQFKAICRLNPTLKDCAAFLEVSEDTVERYCKSLSMSFAEFRDQNMVQTRFSLIRSALKAAENGNPTMMIFCLKNLCGWKDRYDNEITNKTDVDDKTLVNKAKEALEVLKGELKNEASNSNKTGKT